MGSKWSKSSRKGLVPRKEGKVYTSDPKLTAQEACKDLEAKIIADGVGAIVAVADDTTTSLVGSLFSPRGTLNLLALARVRGHDYRITLTKTQVDTDGSPIGMNEKREMVVASVHIQLLDPD